jgi:cell division protein FtsZ
LVLGDFFAYIDQEKEVSMLEFVEERMKNPDIKVFGMGGAGCNAITRMVEHSLRGVDLIAVNTDIQDLTNCSAHKKLQIGIELTKGMGSGGVPDIGRQAAEEDRERIEEVLEGSDMVFITAGMGGGTGTGGSPVVARTAKEIGALTVAIVTKPFEFEGKRRMNFALKGIDELRKEVDTVICISNQKLLAIVGKQTPIEEAFRIADQVLCHATRGISDLITEPGLVNLDFADVRSVMLEGSDAFMGTGTGTGENRARDAAEQAISCPLLEDISIRGAKGLLVNITGGKDLTLFEASDAASTIKEATGSDANVLWGVTVNEESDGDVRVTVIATGIGHGSSLNGLTDIPSMAKEDLDRPTFKRKLSHQEGPDSTNWIPLDPEDLETPTFIRKRNGL